MTERRQSAMPARLNMIGALLLGLLEWLALSRSRAVDRVHGLREGFRRG